MGAFVMHNTSRARAVAAIMLSTMRFCVCA